MDEGGRGRNTREEKEKRKLVEKPKDKSLFSPIRPMKISFNIPRIRPQIEPTPLLLFNNDYEEEHEDEKEGVEKETPKGVKKYVIKEECFVNDKAFTKIKNDIERGRKMIPEKGFNAKNELKYMRRILDIINFYVNAYGNDSKTESQVRGRTVDSFVVRINQYFGLLKVHRKDKDEFPKPKYFIKYYYSSEKVKGGLEAIHGDGFILDMDGYPKHISIKFLARSQKLCVISSTTAYT
ncbi:hypothetical protein Syun_012529 [Stephania yunnanensis]|uniref:Uncharacterized protein n=1 Tax=Stephania yunnanensis TaxID=152371 RepID=A0AAP0K0D8_9MAGN